MTSRSVSCHRSSTVHPKLSQLKRMVRRILATAGDWTATEILDQVRSRCPHWAVTYRYVRKALAIAQREKEEEGEAANCRLFPHDLVEHRSNGSQRKSRRCWRGQVYRVAELADSDSEEELQTGHCKVQWLGQGSMGYTTSTSKVTTLRLIDRPFVLGDRVARVQDPGSLGLVVQVKSACLFVRENQPYPEVPAGSVRPVGGFRTEDLVAHEQSRWVGRVAEALYNVEVQVRKRSASGGRALGICLFQVCSEGHSMLDAVEKGCNQTSWQEMCPHFTGQKVEAGAKVWRQAEWLTEMPKFLNKRFDGYKSLEGTVTSVELQMLGVRWLDSWGKDIIGQHMPPEWVPPSCLTRLELPDSPSEGWSLGEHAQAVLPGSWPCQAVKVLDPRSPSATLTKTTTLVTVCWADGTTEEDVPSTQLLPRQEFYSHDFLPHDLVARSSDADEAWTAEPLQYTAAMAVPPVTAGEDYFPHLGTENLYDDPYEPPQGYHDQSRDQFRDFSNFLGQVNHPPAYPPQTPSTANEILPSTGPPQGISQLPPRVPVGVVQSVNLQARTALVEWRCTHRESPQEVSLFDLAPHPYFELRLGDVVFIPPYLVPEVGHWIGRVVQLQNFTVLVYLGNGAVRPLDLEVLRVASCDLMEGQSEAEHGASGINGLEEHLGSYSDPEVEVEFDQQKPDSVEASSVIFPLPHDAPELTLTSDAGRRFQEQLQEQLETARLQGHVQPTTTFGDPGVPGESEDGAPKMYFYVVQQPQMETGGSSSSTSRPETLAVDTFDEDHEPSDHKFVEFPSPAPKVLMRAVRRELTVLRKGLLDGDEGVVAPILVRTYASRSDLFRAMVVGPPGTPYADLPFFFDLALSPQYPAEPPRVHYLSQFASASERLNPNLYCDGKVCLSLLGTWPGPGWDPNHSTLLQVLVSLQGLVLVEDPYFNEPGHESDAKSEHGRNASALYNENVRLLCLRAALKIDEQPPRGFEEVVARHFSVHGPKLLAQCEEDLQGQGSEGFRQVLSRSILPKLRERWAMK